jgi:hypothetical protein
MHRDRDPVHAGITLSVVSDTLRAIRALASATTADRLGNHSSHAHAIQLDPAISQLFHNFAVTLRQLISYFSHTTRARKLKS